MNMECVSSDRYCIFYIQIYVYSTRMFAFPNLIHIECGSGYEYAENIRIYIMWCSVLFVHVCLGIKALNRVLAQYFPICSCSYTYYIFIYCLFSTMHIAVDQRSNTDQVQQCYIDGWRRYIPDSMTTSYNCIFHFSLHTDHSHAYVYCSRKN